jgi:hydroxymethylbilane synthase
MAGLRRLGLADRATGAIETDVMLPAVAQGAIGVEVRTADDRVREFLAPLNDAASATRIAAERAFLGALDGSCKTPIAALAEFEGDGTLHLRGMVIRPDGTELHETERRGAAGDAEAMGRDAGEELRRTAGEGFFDLPIPDEAPA